MEPLFVYGARGRNRTGTAVKPRDFKSLVSTNFTTRAYKGVGFLSNSSLALRLPALRAGSTSRYRLLPHATLVLPARRHHPSI